MARKPKAVDAVDAVGEDESTEAEDVVDEVELDVDEDIDDDDESDEIVADDEVADDDDEEDTDDDAEVEVDEALEELEAEELELLAEEAEDSLLVNEATELREIRRAELGLNVGAQAARVDEFVCSSCFLVKRTSQLANKRKLICRDCV
jgi:hypothetical protein